MSLLAKFLNPNSVCVRYLETEIRGIIIEACLGTKEKPDMVCLVTNPITKKSHRVYFFPHNTSEKVIKILNDLNFKAVQEFDRIYGAKIGDVAFRMACEFKRKTQSGNL